MSLQFARADAWRWFWIGVKVCGLLDVSAATVYRWMADPDLRFPQPRKFSPTLSLWSYREVQRWIKAQKDRLNESSVQLAKGA